MINSVQSYILRLCFQSFLVSFSFFTFLFVVQQLEVYVQMVVQKHVPVFTVLTLVSYMIPFIASMTLPIAVLFTVILVFSQLSANSEVIAMRACGFSFFDILKPIFYFGVFTMLLTFVFMNFIMNETNIEFKKLYASISQRNPTLNIQERTFDRIPGTDRQISTLKVNTLNQSMESIIIFDYSGSRINIVFSKAGFWTNPSQNQNNLILNDGNIVTINSDSPNVIQNTTFKTAEYYVKMTGLTERSFVKTLDEKGILEIYNEIKAKKEKNQPVPNNYYVAFNKLIAVPISCLLFVVIGVSLGTSFQRAGKGESYGLAVFVVFLFYVLLQTGQVLGTKGYIHPFLAIWLANIVLAVFTVMFHFIKKV